MALAEADLSPERLRKLLGSNFKEFFDPATDDLKASVTGSRANLLRTLRLILQPLSDAAAEVAAETAMNCSAEHVHCGVWDWYLRGLVPGKSPEGDGDYFSAVHLDGRLMLGRKTRAVSSAWGLPDPPEGSLGDPGWWNIWVLLSEDSGLSPLLLLEPSSWNISGFETAVRGAFVWPERDALPGVRLRFQTPRRMLQGDMLLFRSAAVAHGAGRLLGHPPRERPRKPRVSFDVRCHCTPSSTKPVATETGELCANAWKVAGRVHRGCQAPAAAGPAGRPWCAIRRREGDAGAGCILEDGELCAHPCQRKRHCSEYLFDYCETGEP